MHSKTITSLLVAAAAGITNAAPVDTPVGDYTWKISKFSGRKPEGTYYSSISFNIKATNGGLLDFECAASAAWLQDDVFLTCGPNSGISFAWENEYNGLIVKFGDGA
ncbi:uncharacterized protein ALTATR162_LOCUS4956 [Alternaria atra]|uniref:AA1-like domain-containing protein n=1 Tax=Alternaria atra TaxID=119953 RepID=A0A8J2N1B2_9PLEO|nr:uncharacterized protein ALTATR162_LOCUS4956 [Alternaria atra]CAG5157164.1 unnamed protein product [Alternaria atra]